jgi:hypothetical protein
MPQSRLSFDQSNDGIQSSLESAMASMRNAGGKLSEVVQHLAQKDAQLSIERATNKHLEHKVRRLEEQAKLLKQQIGVELSHHARYNAVKEEVKKGLDQESADALLEQSRLRAREILVSKTKKQEDKYAERDAIEKESDDAFEKEIAGLRKKHKARIDAANAASALSGDGGEHKGDASSPGGKKKTTKSKSKDANKRPAIPVPRARFIKDMTPIYNKEKQEALAKAAADNVEGFKYPKLFQWVTEPWKNLDPETKKRKYQDPYDQEKRQREREDAAAGKGDAKRARNETKPAPSKKKKHASDDDESQEEEEAAQSGDDSGDGGDGSDDGGDGSDDGGDGSDDGGDGSDDGDGDGSDDGDGDGDDGENDSD